MWKVTKVTARNFISFNELTFAPVENVCTLIYGHNKDNESQPANGSGKSSLIEAIAYAITGETLRKVKDDEIISDWAEEAEIGIEFENDFNQDVFDVKRMIFRKGTQQIVTKLNGEEVVQPTVLDYNRYILEMLGITKTELYNNFILCRNKYESFLEASDKAKKELINKFSGGDIVDDSIAKLQDDMQPAYADMMEAEQKCVILKGKIDAISEQIEDAQAQLQSASKAKEEKIAELKAKVEARREDIRAVKIQIKKADERLNALEEAQNPLEDFENSDIPFNDCYTDICMLFDDLKLPAIKDYKKLSSEYTVAIKGIKQDIEKQTSLLKDTQKTCAAAETAFKKAKLDYEEAKKEYQDMGQKNKDEYAVLDIELKSLNDHIAELRKKVREANRSISSVEQQIIGWEAQIQGKVVCPNCQHEFVLNSELSLEELMENTDNAHATIKDLQSNISSLQETIDAEDSKIADNSTKRDELMRAESECDRKVRSLKDKFQEVTDTYDRAASEFRNLESGIDKAKRDMEATQGRLDALRTNMFDEAYNIIDAAMTKGEAYLSAQKTQVTSLEAAIDSFQQSIKELENSSTGDITASLKVSLNKYKVEHDAATEEYQKVKAAYDALKVQENYFMDFKSYLACEKIEAISQMVNDFLTKIGSDIRLELVGYTRLKSGKLRDKISINILRDGVDCGTFHKFSQGEKTRINLASILALQKLVNVSAPEGRGLDLLICDEILDASDVGGLISYCETITKLGITALMISQNQLPESYPYQLQVIKQGGKSHLAV